MNNLDEPLNPPLNRPFILFGIGFVLAMAGELMVLRGTGATLDSPRVLNTLTDPDLFRYPFSLQSLPQTIIGIILFMGSILALTASGLSRDDPQKNAESERFSWIIVALLTCVALALRCTHLDQIPWGFFLDEGFNALDARNIADGVSWPIFLTGNGGRESLFFYGMAACLRIFGDTIFGMRFFAALSGTLTIPAVFLLGRKLFGSRVALIAAAFMTFSSWQLHFSRLGFRYILLPLFTSIVFWLCLEVIERRTILSGLWFGFFLGLGLYTYVPYRLFPAIPFLYIFLVVMADRSLLRHLWKPLFASAATSLVVSAPLVYFFTVKAPSVLQRVGQTLNIPESGVFSLDMLRLVGRSCSMFIFWGDALLRHSLPTFPVFTALASVLWFIGILICLINIRRPLYLTLLVWHFVMLLPTIISVGNPSHSRSIGVSPAAFLVISLAIDAIWKRIQQKSKVHALPLIVTLVIVMIFASGEVKRYFSDWPGIGQQLPRFQESLFGYCRYETKLCEALQQREPSVTVYLTPQLFLHPTIKFLTMHEERIRLLDPDRLDEPSLVRGTSWIIGEKTVRNLWWIRNSPTKNMFFWENLRKGLSDRYLANVIVRSYGSETPVMSSDQGLLDNVVQEYPSAPVTLIEGFTCIVVPGRAIGGSESQRSDASPSNSISNLAQSFSRPPIIARP